MDPIAQSLDLVRRFAGAPWVHKLGIYNRAQKVAYVGTREGFKAAGVAARCFKAAQKRLAPERLPSVTTSQGLFDLSLNEEQQMMSEMVQRLAREVMRDAAPSANDACEVSEAFWRQVAELGLLQFAVPEGFGGAATESWECTQAIAAEELAYGDMGLAVAALAPVAVANALTRWGSGQQQETYLPAFTGDNPPRAALAIAERRPAFDPLDLKTRATVDGEGYLLNGEKTLVPLANTAELFLVAANLVGKGPCVFIVEAGTGGVTVETEPGMGVRAASMGNLKLASVRLPTDALLGEDLSVLDYQALVDRAQIAWCALAVGTARAVLDYVIEYCNERVAFGEPISHRQSVAFMISNIAIELDAMRLLTWRAASRAERNLPFHREAYLAKVLCLEKAMQIGTDGVQLLGGHGYTKDHPVERWYRDLMIIGPAEGGLQL